MRHSDREIRDHATIDQIINSAQVLRIGSCKENMPYIVPVCFGYDGKYIYFHTSAKGMKIDYMTFNQQVCFELEDDIMVIPNACIACKWSMSFRSVIGFGMIQEMVVHEDKIHALDHIMKHYSGSTWEFDEDIFKITRVWRISILDIKGRQSKDRVLDTQSSIC